jgi:hypothetical protein
MERSPYWTATGDSQSMRCISTRLMSTFHHREVFPLTMQLIERVRIHAAWRTILAGELEDGGTVLHEEMSQLHLFSLRNAQRLFPLRGPSLGIG